MISANTLLGKDGHSVRDQWRYRGLWDCGKDWYLEPVLLFLFESDSSRQMHWIASVSCALYHRLISLCMRDVWVTNHCLLWRSCAFPWKKAGICSIQLTRQLTASLWCGLHHLSIERRHCSCSPAPRLCTLPGAPSSLVVGSWSLSLSWALHT